MSDSPLRNAAEIYSPFTVEETKRLRGFVADVETLAASSFFKNPGNKITLRGGVDQPLTTEMHYAGEEAVRAMVPIFRQLYSHTEPTSMRAIFRMFKEHVHTKGGPLRDQALAGLDDLLAMEKEILKEDPLVAMLEANPGPGGGYSESSVSPRQLIDWFLHGHYLHKGNEKSARLETWDGVPDLAKFRFFSAVIQLRNLYWVARNVVAEVFKAPELLDAS